MSNTKTNTASNASASTTWANRTKAAAAAVPLTKAAPAKDRGVRHLGVVETFRPVPFKTGSFGIEIKYTVEGVERAVYENIVLKLMTKDGNLEATKYGESTLKKRLQAFGLSADDILNFPIPKTPKDESEAYNFAGAPVALYLIDEEYMEKAKKAVRAVFPIDFDDNNK